MIFSGGDPARHRERMSRFGEFVARLGGTYMPGVDMGTTTSDLMTMARAGAPATCSVDDPSPWTALGVFEAIRSAVAHVDQRDDLKGISVAIQGAGHVGAALARLLAGADAQVIVSDLDETAADRVAREVGGRTTPPSQAHSTQCDVFAPCATARVLTCATIDVLQCRIVTGAANDTLQAPRCADLLAQAGVVYVPDFLANAGGVVHIHSLTAKWEPTHIEQEVRRIGARVTEVLAESAERDITPLAAAQARARRRIAEQRHARERTRDHSPAHKIRTPHAD